MKLAVLFSGGKDSNFALYEASKKHTISCLITIISQNDSSYMFQTQGIDFTKFQAKVLNIPQILIKTKGEKELELNDLRKAIFDAKEKYGIGGIVSGAIGSVYQASRVQKICDELNLWCFNPLWQKNQIEFLKELIAKNFEILIVGIASYPLDKNFLGKIIDNNMINKLEIFEKKYGLNPAGEGGEIETFVLNSPCFKQKLEISDFEIVMDSENCGKVLIEDIKISDKENSKNKDNLN